MASLSLGAVPYSDYLYKRSPDKYGGQQEDYYRLSEIAIGTAVDLMREGAASSKDPSDIFFDVIKMMWESRHAIAVKHGTDKSHLFGVLRKDTKATCLSPITGLGSPYDEYNRVCLAQLHPILMGLKHDLRTFTDFKTKPSETVLGRTCSFEVEVFDGDRLREKGIDRVVTKEELRAVLGVDKSLSEVLSDVELVARLKKESKELYDRLTLNQLIINIIHTYPPPKVTAVSVVGDTDYLKSLYVVGTLRLEIVPGKCYALSRYLTWMYQDYATDPVDRMKARSIVTVVHQDMFLNPETLKAVAQLFKEAFSFDPAKDTVKALKERVALIRFVYAHCMPCARGDGAVGDWLELALYRYHGFTKTRFNPDKLPAFEPLASLSFSRYLGAYDSIITVE